MVELADIQAVYYMVAATGVLVAAIFYILNLRVSQRNQELMLKSQEQTLQTRQAQRARGLDANTWTAVESEYLYEKLIDFGRKKTEQGKA